MTEHVTITPPSKLDGAAVWRVARDSGTLDLNSSYAYLMWASDFADTSVIACQDDEVVGFILGYRKQADPDKAVVWQVAVDDSQRGKGLGGRMLDTLFTELVGVGVCYLDTTVTPSNGPSIKLFSSFADRWGAELVVHEHFAAHHFPDAHEREDLYRIGPLARQP